MNIKQAKDQIRSAVIAYRTRGEDGIYVLPLEQQRPLFLTGAPGIGKTAVVQQVAEEMHIGFVSYSITHHTRQSALGLPYITDRSFDGTPYRISEYTMSEIIAAAYLQMEETGVREGILFLDEINCVSETLAPAMLQFLQYKVFGQHRIPDGWIVVTAGNPPMYNRSVREFDVVTQDRLKIIDIEPDFEAWRSWAENEQVHPAVLSYLRIHPADVFAMKNDLSGLSFVTPRGWTDLSRMLRLFEQNSLAADILLISQYLRDEPIARRFAAFYAMFCRTEHELPVGQILEGQTPPEFLQSASSAPFDERLALTALLLEQIRNRISPVVHTRDWLLSLKPHLQTICASPDPDTARDMCISELTKQKKSPVLGRTERADLQRTISWISENHPATYQERYKALAAALQQDAREITAQLDHIFSFLEEAYGEDSEMAYLVTSLTTQSDCARFIALYGSQGYYRHNQSLMLYERKLDMLREIDTLLGEA